MSIHKLAGAVSRLQSKRFRSRVLKNFRRSRGMKAYAYYASYPFILWLKAAGLGQLSFFMTGAGVLAHRLMPGRRKTAMNNLRAAYKNEKTEREIEIIAKQSAGSFLLSFAETIRFHSLLEKPSGFEFVRKNVEGLDAFLSRTKEIHERSEGCIFLSPHLGCYGLLPYLFAASGIRIVIPIGDAGNDYIQARWFPLHTERRVDGEIFVSKKNSLGLLKGALRQGRSVGMLPDQRTQRGVPARFFDIVAPTTPVPALLSVGYQRPIVVVACYRKGGSPSYELVLCEPLLPRPGQDKKAEVVRLTREMNLQMETLIRKRPEQYLWLHDRWKPYRSKTATRSPWVSGEAD
jgi:KDO2-lipid IV(A) lauroyltransferase